MSLQFDSSLCNLTTDDLHFTHNGVLVNRRATDTALCLCGQPIFRHPQRGI